MSVVPAPQEGTGGLAQNFDEQPALIRQISQLIKDLLDLDLPPDDDDDIFALGGSSLEILRLVDLIRNQFGVAVPIGDLLLQPTVEAIADLVATGAPVTTVPVSSPSDRGSAPFSYWQEARLRANSFDGERSSAVQLTYDVTGPLDSDRLDECLRAVVERHPTLRTMAVAFDSGIIAATPGRIIDSAPATPEQAARDLVDFLARPIDPWTDLPVHAIHRELAADRHVVSIAVDHLMFDGTSAAILLAELAGLYNNPDAELPAARSYFDFAANQRQETVSLKAQLDFWRETLADIGPHPRITLPLEKGRTGAETGPGEVVHSLVADDRFREVLDGLRAVSATQQQLLLTSSVRALRKDLDVDLAGAVFPYQGRDWPGSADVIGPFANLVAVRTPPFVEDPLEHLAACGLALRESIAHSAVPFPEILRQCFPDAYGVPIAGPYLFFDTTGAAVAPPRFDKSVWVERLAPKETLNRFHPGINITGRSTPAGYEIQVFYSRGVQDAGAMKTLVDGIRRELLELADAARTAHGG